jgi:hypothetical protein
MFETLANDVDNAIHLVGNYFLAYTRAICLTVDSKIPVCWLLKRDVKTWPLHSILNWWTSSLDKLTITATL